MTDTIRILLADTQRIWCLGVRSILAAEPDLALVGEAGNAWEAQRLSRELSPHILLLEVDLPGLPEKGMIAFLQHECPEARILVLMDGDKYFYLAQLLAAGAAGHVSRRESPEALADALRTAVWGTKLPARAPDPELSPREREVLRLVAQGRTNMQIAVALGIAERTARFHVGNLCHKLGLQGRAELIAWAVRRGLG